MKIRNLTINAVVHECPRLILHLLNDETLYTGVNLVDNVAATELPPVSAGLSQDLWGLHLILDHAKEPVVGVLHENSVNTALAVVDEDVALAGDAYLNLDKKSFVSVDVGRSTILVEVGTTLAGKVEAVDVGN